MLYTIHYLTEMWAKQPSKDKKAQMLSNNCTQSKKCCIIAFFATNFYT